MVGVGMLMGGRFGAKVSVLAAAEQVRLVFKQTDLIEKNQGDVIRGYARNQ